MIRRLLLALALAFAPLAAVAGTSLTPNTNFSQLTNALSGNVALNNTTLYFDGPSVAQGTVGTWFASGFVTVLDTGGAALIECNLWDGTTVIATSGNDLASASKHVTISLSGYMTNPAANLRISCKDTTLTTGSILASGTGGGNFASVLSVFRLN